MSQRSGFFVACFYVAWDHLSRAFSCWRLNSCKKQDARDKWFQATLVDTYLAFFTFYVWVFYKEAKWLGRILWFVLIMLLGNLAIAAYVLLQIWKSKDGSAPEILLRR